MSINSNLRQLRLERGMTQEQAAALLGVTRQAVSSYESGRTRPDLDMLLRMCEVYHTNLEGILYGRDAALQRLRRLKIAAVTVFALLVGLTLLASLLLWSANWFFPVPDGFSFGSPEMEALWHSRTRLTGAWEVVGQLDLSVSLFGFLVLLVFKLTGRCALSWKVELRYLLALAGAILAVTAPFAFTDPVFRPVNYYIVPIHILCRMALFWLIGWIAGLVRRRRGKTKSGL